MFRLVSKRIVAQATLARSIAPPRAFFSSSESSPDPSIHDVLINLTLIDPSGARRKKKAMIGKY
jgi:hypothetical protein